MIELLDTCFWLLAAVALLWIAGEMARPWWPD